MTRPIIAALALAASIPITAQACEESQKLLCDSATYCAHPSAADGAWIASRNPGGPSRFPKVPDRDEAVLILVEVEGGFGTQRLYTLGSFGDCAWSFENDYVSRSKVGRRILSWKRLDEPQYTE